MMAVFFRLRRALLGGLPWRPWAKRPVFPGDWALFAWGRAVMRGAVMLQKQAQNLFGRYWRRELLAWMLQEPMPQGLLVGSPCRSLVR